MNQTLTITEETRTFVGPRDHVIALLNVEHNRGSLVNVSAPRELGDGTGHVAVKAVLLVTRQAGQAVAVRTPATPARVPLRHPAAKPGWSIKRKVAVTGGVLLGGLLVLGWLVSQLLRVNLAQAATTLLGLAAVIALLAFGRMVTGHKPTCAGLHCSGCSGH